MVSSSSSSSEGRAGAEGVISAGGSEEGFDASQYRASEGEKKKKKKKKKKKAEEEEGRKSDSGEKMSDIDGSGDGDARKLGDGDAEEAEAEAEAEEEEAEAEAEEEEEEEEEEVENDHEELSVLPRHTKVIVTGNNRTKSVLVGSHGVVKKAVGLGGWHWLVLTNGLEVKLQRNALSVLEPPTGLEEDENDSEEGRSNVDYQRPFRTRVRPQKPASIARPSHKSLQVADASSTAGSKSSHRILKVNLSKLETDALLRYWRRFKLVEAGPHSSKQQLVDAVERHFSSQQLDEIQVIARFVQAAKRLKTIYH